jgi:long-chain fatty acid transport protein
MKKFASILGTASLSLFLFASQALAAGFALPEQGAAAMGMSSAFVGQADDASAVWYNPAGITQLDGIRAMGGVVFIYPSFSHENTDGTTDTASRASHAPALMYATYKINDTIWLGFGVNNPFGLATDWHHNSETREVALLSQVISTEFNPNIAFKITDKLSMAAGFSVVYLAATLSNTQRVILPGPIDLGNHYSRLSGSGTGLGGNIALLYKFSDTVSTGLTYRSRISVDINGIASLSGGPAAQSATASSTITLPDLLTWGISIKASDKLTLNADLGYTWWSTYDELIVSSGNPNFNNKRYDKQWRNVFNVRMGGQYKLTDHVKLRAGYQYDQNPVPDHYFETRVPDSDRHGVSIGAGYSLGNLTIDVAYLYLLFETRNIGDSAADNATTNSNSLRGTYKTDAHVIGMSVAYKF